MPKSKFTVLIWMMFLIFNRLAVCQQPLKVNQIPRYLDSCANTWLNKAKCFGKFRYEISVNRETDNTDRTAVAFGKVSVHEQSFRIKWDWNPIHFKGSSISPTQNFDFLGTRRCDAYLGSSGKVNSSYLSLSPNPSSKRATNFGTKAVPRVVKVAFHDGEFLDLRYPIYKIPTVFSFCGGWNEGVFFGGLETGINTIERLKKHFAIHGSAEIEEFEAELYGPDDILIRVDNSEDSIVVHQKLKSKEGYALRKIRFERFDGIMLKVLEDYKRVENGDLKFSKVMKVDNFVTVAFVPIPTLLESKTVWNNKKFSVSQTRKFKLIPDSIRPATSIDQVLQTGVDKSDDQANVYSPAKLESHSQELSLPKSRLSRRKLTIESESKWETGQIISPFHLTIILLVAFAIIAQHKWKKNS